MEGRNFVDVKVTIWQRYYFTDPTDMKEVAKTIQENAGVQGICDNENFMNMEYLDETETVHHVSEDGQSTIEVFENDKTIWENGTQPSNH